MPCGDQVRKYRELRNYTQEVLAGLSGLPTSAISKIENGTRNVTWDEAVRFVDVLGIRLDDLAGASGVPLIRADVVAQELREARLSLQAAELRLAVLDHLAAGSLIQGAVAPAEDADEKVPSSGLEYLGSERYDMALIDEDEALYAFASAV